MLGNGKNGRLETNLKPVGVNLFGERTGTTTLRWIDNVVIKK